MEAQAVGNELQNRQSHGTTENENLCSNVIVIKRFVDYPLSDIAQIAKLVDIPKGKLVMLLSEKENGVMFFSEKLEDADVCESNQGNFDCGKLVKEYGTEGKGGGKSTNARVVFDEKVKLDAFLQSLCTAIEKSNNL